MNKIKIKLNEDKELVENIDEALKNNNNYCPCVLNSNGQEDFKCMCKSFREQRIGMCHCGKFIKYEEGNE